MTNTNITTFRKNVFDYVNQAVLYGEPVSVSTKHGNAILLSEQDYNNMLETLRLSTIPGMEKSLLEAAEEPLEDCLPYDPKEPW